MDVSPLKFMLIPGSSGKALKIRKDGFIHYCIYTDQFAKHYIKMTHNETETKVSGSVSHILFCLHDVEQITSKAKLPIAGYNENNGKIEESWDNDTPGFLTAVVKDIMGNI